MTPTVTAAQGAVVHVERARPGDTCGVEIELVAVEHVRVDERGEQVVSRRDGVEVAVEVQVDLVGGLDLRASAARRSALHAEDGAERRLARGEDGALADALKPLHEADGGDGLAFAGYGRRGGGHEDQLAVSIETRIMQQIERKLGADRAALFVEVLGQVQLVGDRFNR